MASLQDILNRLDQTLSNMNTKGTGVMSSLNSVLSNLGNKIGTSPLPPGVQGPPGPSGGPLTKFLSDFLTQGDFKSKLDQMAGVTKGLGLEDLSKGILTATTAARAVEGDPVAMLELGKEAINLVRSQAQNIAAHGAAAGEQFKAGLTSERAPTAAGHFLRSQAEMMETVPIVGKMAAGFTKLEARLVESVDRLRDFNTQLLRSDLQFAEFSASMAGVEIENEVRNAFLSAERGEHRAGAARNLAEGRFELEQQMARFEDPFARIKDRLVGTLDRVIAKGIDMSGLGLLADLVSKILDWLDEHEEAADNLAEAHAGMTVASVSPMAGGAYAGLRGGMKLGEWLAEYGKPKRHQ